MNRTHVSRRTREKKLNRLLMIAFALVLFLGACSQIAMMARLTGQNKQLVATRKETHEWQAKIDNLELSLSKYHNHDRITALAKQLGMTMPEGSQLRVVNLPALVESTSTQSADSSGAEEIMD
ncbi:MAG: cell division protein FtsL [Clostridia bacterium]|nr:cell division protein FtsL [Clostridia bacterium]